MAEDERTVEAADGATRNDDVPTASDATASADADGGTRDDRAVGGGIGDVVDRDRADDVVERLLELETDLEGGTDTGDGRVRGLVTAAERVDAAAVPDGYPLDPGADEVLAVTVDLGGDEATVYLEWPENGTESRLEWLLDAAGIRLGDLYGRRLLLERTRGYYTVVTPPERPRSSGDWGVGVGSGHAVNVALLGLLVATGGLPTLYAAWALLTFLGLPYATYKDAWYVRTHSDWDQGPLFWATLSAVPALNVVVGLTYLWTRRRAAFFGSEPSLLARSVRTIRSLR